jgi:hypothetical protein
MHVVPARSMSWRGVTARAMIDKDRPWGDRMIRMKHCATILLLALALLAGAASAASSITTLSVSNAAPAYNVMVTLTSTTKDASGGAAASGTVSFYEDGGILLQTANVTSGTAQWKQKFLAGQHTVYAVFSGNGALATSTSATVALNISSALAVPSTGAYLGIRPDPPLGKGQEAAMEVREGPPPNGIGRTFALHLLYYGWQDFANTMLSSKGVFQPDSDLEGDIKHGRVPTIAWNCGGILNSVIAAGDPKQDANITASAKALSQYPGPVLLRWFWEFNDLGNNQDCRGDNGSPTQQTYNNFIGAWQHIWTLFQAAGATNVVFMWNPGYYSAGATNKGYAPNFYPGNTFVDWIGLDSYQRSNSATFKDDIQPFYGDFSQPQYGSKPLIIGENGSPNWGRNNLELQWTYVQGILSDMQSDLYPLLKGYHYFDSTGPAGSWVLDDNNGQGNGGLAAFTILGASPLFAPMPNSAPAKSAKPGRPGHCPPRCPGGKGK